MRRLPKWFLELKTLWRAGYRRMHLQIIPRLHMVREQICKDSLHRRLRAYGRNRNRAVSNTIMLPLFPRCGTEQVLVSVCGMTKAHMYLRKQGTFPHNSLVTLEKPWGCFHAIQWLVDMKFDNVDFVTDSKVTTDAFNSPRHDLTEFGYIITACWNLFFS